MIEQKVEKLVVERFERLFAEKNFDIQVIGSMQPSTVEKAEEDGGTGVLAVKVQPREYETPTVPTCRLNGVLSLQVRADADFGGGTFLDVCDVVMDELEDLQKCLYDVHERYAVPNEWMPTGFVVGAGDVNVDAQARTWGYTHAFTMYGIIE